MRLFLILSSILVLALPSVLYGQVEKLSLEFISRNSDIIVYGTVKDVVPFRSRDEGFIKSVNTIKVQSVLKGQYPENTLDIITFGGRIGDEVMTFSHLPVLTKDERGLFFLKKSGNRFRIFGGVQGVIKFDDFFEGKAKSYFDTYNDVYVDLFPRLKMILGERFNDNFDLRNRKCLQYKFESELVFVNNTVKLKLHTKAKQSYGANNVLRLGVIAKYDTVLFGINVVQNNIVSFEKNPLLVDYSLVAQDIASDKFGVFLEFDPSNNQSVPIALGSTNYIDLFDLETIPINVNNQLIFDLLQSEILDASEYIIETGGTSKYDCLTYEANFGNLSDSISIESVDFRTVAAGVDIFGEDDFFTPGEITIRGKNFKEPLPGHFKPSGMILGFINAGKSSSFYCYPPKRDITVWNDSTITVKVPAIDSSGNNQTYAGNGQIVVFNRNTFEIASSDSITINYVATNTVDGFIQGPDTSRISEPIKLIGANDSAGYTIYFTQKIFDSIPGVQEAFQRALNTWRCNTGYNAIIKDSINITNIDSACAIIFNDALPEGVTSTLAVTSRIAPDCGAGIVQGYFPKFDLIINKYLFRSSTAGPEEINWHTSINPLPEVADTFPNRDLETVILHELGHALGLRHIRNPNDVMFPLHRGTLRSLSPQTDLQGGKHCVNISTMDPHCQNKMQLYNCLLDNVSNYLDPIIDIKIYPNPTTNVLNLVVSEIVGNNGDNFHLIIYNSIGRQVYSNHFTFYEKIVVETENLECGFYNFVLSNGNGISFAGKFVKQ